MTDLRVTGRGTAGRVAAALRCRTGERLRRDVEAAMDRGVVNVEAYFRAGAQLKMPQRGGFADELARGQVRVTRIPYGVRLTVLSRHDMPRIERGRLRHPVFGDREVWAMQRVPADVVRDAVERANEEIIAELDRVLTGGPGGAR